VVLDGKGQPRVHYALDARDAESMEEGVDKV
jgi:hypothetical protein